MRGQLARPVLRGPRHGNVSGLPAQGFVLEWRRHSYRWYALAQYVQQDKDGLSVPV
jgi:hypothetical protein